jgi:hypothetical protein
MPCIHSWAVERALAVAFQGSCVMWLGVGGAELEPRAPSSFT